MVSNSNLPELKKKKKTTEKGHSFTFSSLPSTPSFTLFLCSSARQMLAVTSQHDMASFSKELLLITALPAVSDNSVMPTHSQLCLQDNHSPEDDDSAQLQQQAYVQLFPHPSLKQNNASLNCLFLERRQLYQLYLLWRFTHYIRRQHIKKLMCFMEISVK